MPSPYLYDFFGSMSNEELQYLGLAFKALCMCALALAGFMLLFPRRGGRERVGMRKPRYHDPAYQARMMEAGNYWIECKGDIPIDKLGERFPDISRNHLYEAVSRVIKVIGTIEKQVAAALDGEFQTITGISR